MAVFSSLTGLKGVEWVARPIPEIDKVINTDSMGFVASLVRAFRGRVDELLRMRAERQARFDRGERPRFLPETAEIRAGNWKVAGLPPDLKDRRVEITGPVDRKMIINALNSGANVFMADFEDSLSPTWDNVLVGQANLMDAVRRTISFTGPEHKTYALNPTVATLMVRPRGWHLTEKHIRVDGQSAPAALVDFGLYFFLNARELQQRNTGPYFYLPKLESHHEARLWNDVFVAAQQALNIPLGTIKATVLIETLPAAFEMDEILYELRQHSAGLNCGRWDYIFSFIKKLRQDPRCVLPDRSQVTMEQPNMRAYTRLVIKTCHRRGVHAMGGMAAQIPIRANPDANAAALEKVRADKLREVKDGHDGTWVAHPGLVPVAREIFDAHMRSPNQLHVMREDVNVTEADLLAVPTGTRTEPGLRHNIRVGIQYLEAWLRGQGCVPLYNLMEDAATAEISRAQVWQWMHHRVPLEDGTPVTPDRLHSVTDQEMERIRTEVGEEAFRSGRFADARNLFDGLCLDEQFEEFLTLPAYALLTGSARRA